MSYKLFLDDVRDVDYVKDIKTPDVPWVIARSYDEFVEAIKTRGMPQFIAFDHDLSDQHVCDYILNAKYTGVLAYETYLEKTGFSCAKWLVEHCMNNGLKLPPFYCHSANSIGRDNINSYLDCFNRN